MSGTSICVEMPRFAACAGLTTESSALTTDACLGSSVIASSSLATPPEPGCTKCTDGSRVGSSDSHVAAAAAAASLSTARMTPEMVAPLSV